MDGGKKRRTGQKGEKERDEGRVAGLIRKIRGRRRRRERKEEWRKTYLAIHLN